MSKYKPFNELTTMKLVLISGIIIGSSLFGDSALDSIFGSDGNDHGDRITRVEVQNEAHVIFMNQLAKSADLVSQLQQNQRDLFTQISNLTETMKRMQDREYARLKGM